MYFIVIFIDYYGTSLQNDDVSWIKKFICYWAEHTAADLPTMQLIQFCAFLKTMLFCRNTTIAH